LANTLIAESKLQFYPTSEIETYRMLPFIGQLQTSMSKYIFELIATEEEKREFEDSILSNGTSFPHFYYDYFLKKGRVKTLQKEFKIKVGSKEGDLVIADLFAGEGKWLETFKTFLPYTEDSGNVVCIANEIEKGRYNKIKNNPHIDDCYNSAFEDLELPKKSISIMLFNPPYGETNGERNVRRYLRMILERELMVGGGLLIGVIRKDDIEDCMDLFGQYFWTWQLYRTDEEEYKKWGQYVYVGTLKNYPYDLKTPVGVKDLERDMNKIKKMLEENTNFQPYMYSNYGNGISKTRWNIVKNNVKIIKDKEKYQSKPDEVLKWIKDITELKDLSQEKITLPKPPKTGEIANIIASGMINGELDLNGKGKHIVVGGVKDLERVETETTENNKGEKIIETKTIRYNEPYLNLLVNQNGKLMVKELGGNK
jgi:hypothetical protein